MENLVIKTAKGHQYLCYTYNTGGRKFEKYCIVADLGSSKKVLLFELEELTRIKQVVASRITGIEVNTK